MPIYRYLCTACDEGFEVQAKMADAAPQKAPGCNESHCHLVKQLSRVAILTPGKASLSAAKSHLQQADAIITKSGASTKSQEDCGEVCPASCQASRYLSRT